MSPRWALACAALSACSSPTAPIGADAAGAADASEAPQAPDANCPLAPVTVAVYGNPSVIFANPDGTTFGVVGGPNGLQADGCVQEGATATAVYPSGTTGAMYSVRGVKPGDSLTFPTPSQPPTSTPVPPFVVNFTTLGKKGPNAPAYSYYAVGPCGRTSGTTSPINLEMWSDCLSSSMQIQVLAYDANNALVSYVLKDNVAYSDGSTTMPSTYLAAATVTASYSNIPAGTPLEFTRVAGVSASLATVTNAASSQLLQVVGVVASPARAVTKLGSRSLEEPLDASATAYSVDVAASMLPMITDCSLDVATGEVSMTTATSGLAPDFAWATYNYWHGPTQSQIVLWAIQGPPGDFTLPQLGPYQYLAPVSGDIVRYGGVEMVESPSWTWDDVRNGMSSPASTLRKSQCGRQGI